MRCWSWKNHLQQWSWDRCLNCSLDPIMSNRGNVCRDILMLCREEDRAMCVFPQIHKLRRERSCQCRDALLGAAQLVPTLGWSINVYFEPHCHSWGAMFLCNCHRLQRSQRTYWWLMAHVFQLTHFQSLKEGGNAGENGLLSQGCSCSNPELFQGSCFEIGSASFCSSWWWHKVIGFATSHEDLFTICYKAGKLFKST